MHFMHFVCRSAVPPRTRAPTDGGRRQARGGALCREQRVRFPNGRRRCVSGSADGVVIAVVPLLLAPGLLSGCGAVRRPRAATLPPAPPTVTGAAGPAPPPGSSCQGGGAFDGGWGCRPGEAVTVSRVRDAATFQLVGGRLYGPPCGPPVPATPEPAVALAPAENPHVHVDVDHHHNSRDGALTGGFCRRHWWC